MGRIILDRIILREVRCLSWDEESYKLLYGVDEGNGLRACRYIILMGGIKLVKEFQDSRFNSISMVLTLTG
jgi:hypothetical protein